MVTTRSDANVVVVVHGDRTVVLPLDRQDVVEDALASLAPDSC